MWAPVDTPFQTIKQDVRTRSSCCIQHAESRRFGEDTCNINLIRSKIIFFSCRHSQNSSLPYPCSALGCQPSLPRSDFDLRACWNRTLVVCLESMSRDGVRHEDVSLQGDHLMNLQGFGTRQGQPHQNGRKGCFC